MKLKRLSSPNVQETAIQKSLRRDPMEKDTLPNDEEISNEDLEKVSGGIGINTTIINADKWIKIDTGIASVSTNILKIDTLIKK
jgi:hypothetical protein